jgi:hypothetical protein
VEDDDDLPSCHVPAGKALSGRCISRKLRKDATHALSTTLPSDFTNDAPSHDIDPGVDVALFSRFLLFRIFFS